MKDNVRLAKEVLYLHHFSVNRRSEYKNTKYCNCELCVLARDVINEERG